MNMTQEEMIRQEVQRQLGGGEGPSRESQFKGQMYSLGGGLVGGAAGYAAINPVEAFIQNAQVKRSAAATQAKDILGILKEIHEGKLSWDNIPDEATRVALQEEYANNKHLFQDPQALEQMMGDGKGKVYRFADAIEGAPGAEDTKKYLQRANLKRFLPDANVLRHAHKLGHPAVSIGSLGGMAGGYALANHLEKKKHTEST